MLAAIKTGIHKSLEWEYESEWRLINVSSVERRSHPDITPVKIIDYRGGIERTSPAVSWRDK